MGNFFGNAIPSAKATIQIATDCDGTGARASRRSTKNTLLTLMV